MIQYQPLAPDQAEVRMLYNGHCESDATVAHAGKHPSQDAANTRILLGHEPVGEVTAIGPGVFNLMIGQIVAIEPGISCGNCVECHAGRYNTCRQVRYMATPSVSWGEGSYARIIRWPATLCHVVPDGLDPMVAALAESMAAGREAIDSVGRTRFFKPSRETVLIVGGGQMAMNILMQLKARWETLRVFVMARDPLQRERARRFGADYTIPLSTRAWDYVERQKHILAAAEEPDATLDSIRERAAAVRHARESNKEIVWENQQRFDEARRMAGQEIACMLECTGQSHILNSALNARTIRGQGGYGLISCLYRMKHDVADYRRDAAITWHLRRSCDQFPPTLRELARNKSAYKQLIGRVIDFDDVPLLYGSPAESSQVGMHIEGGGPKIMIKY
jgi:threonine dehydrogenase-like Zn-dependent dehydrogenase